MAKIYLIVIYVVAGIFSASSLDQARHISCTFDSDLCGWHSVTSGKFQWKRGTGQTEDRTSGPLNDHTCENSKGEYVYISGEEAEGRKDIAVLESDSFATDNDTTLSFWYIMNGFGTGSLVLSLISENTTEDVWKKEGRQGKDWIKHTVSLKPGRIKLQFKANVRIPMGSDIAIDDIKLSTESQFKDLNKTHCKLSPTTIITTTTTTTPPTTTSTTSTKKLTKTHKASFFTTIGSSKFSASSTCLKYTGETQLLPGTCDFEKDTCGIKITANHANKMVTWERTYEKNKYSADNIHGDHTFESDETTNGFYLVFRNGFSIWNSRLTATLETPAIYAKYACLTFWYNVPSNYSNLKVSVREYTGRLSTVWSMDNFIPSMKAANMNGWQEKTLSLMEDPPFTIVFETNNNWHYANVGLDDLKIVGTNGTTEKTKPVTKQTVTINSMSDMTTEGKQPSGQTTLSSFNSQTETNIIPSVKQTTQDGRYTGTTMFSQRTKTPEVSAVGTTSFTVSTERTTTLKVSSEGTTTHSSRESSSVSLYSITETQTNKEDKKTTNLSTKKPTKVDFENGNKDKQTETEKYEKISTIVGGTVGAVFGIVLMIVILYLVVDSKCKAKRKRRQDIKNKATSKEQLNNGVSNAGLTSETFLSASVSYENPKANGYTGNTYDNFTVYSVNQVNTFSLGHRQGNCSKTDTRPNGHISPIAEEEKHTRL